MSEGKENPVERLNYFNGQRLQAGDFQLEQDYHLRMRRELNRALYTPGIARGLEVFPGGGAKVIVAPGFAIDSEGREMLLLEPCKTDVRRDLDQGAYLAIRYNEQLLAHQDACCASSAPIGDRAAQGGPSRVLEQPVLEWVSDPPDEQSDMIALARVTLTEHCEEVNVIDTSCRRYVRHAPDSKVRQYALEGVRDIDSKNPGIIRFHIRGRQPNAVTLYLRAEEFPSLYYTELGWHSHETKGNIVGNINFPSHFHDITPIESPNFSESVSAGTPETETASSLTINNEQLYYLMDDRCLTSVNYVTKPPGVHWWTVHHGSDICDPSGTGNTISVTPFDTPKITIKSMSHHSHKIPTATKKWPDKDTELSITITNTPVIDNAGVENSPQRPMESASALTFVNNLHVLIGPSDRPLTEEMDKTENILGQLQAAHPDDAWTQLGNGNSTHALAAKGTGPIRLDYLAGVSFADDTEYVIELHVADGGGRIHCNLYIE